VRFDWDRTGRELVAAYHDALALPAPLATRLTADGAIAEDRYWALRGDVGGAGMSLVEPGRPLLPIEAQRGLAALTRRRATRWAIVGPLRFFGRLGNLSRAQRNGGPGES
jgi:hypothetical protein